MHKQNGCGVKKGGVMAGELNEELRDLSPGFVQSLITTSLSLSLLVCKMEKITPAFQVFTYEM